MNKTIRTAAVVIPAAAALVMAANAGPSSASAHAATPTASRVTAAAKGPGTSTVPTLIQPDADLRPQAGTPHDSWYAVGHISAGGDQYGFVVHYLVNAAAKTSISDVSVVDATTGWHAKSELTLAAGQGLSGTGGVNIRTGNMAWTGNAREMTLKAEVPQGTLDLTFRPRGPVLYNMATGYFPLFNQTEYPQYEYAFPAMTTTGQLIRNGHSARVTGQTWFDRQWGPQPADLATGKASWTWMDLNLSNGDKLSLWDTIDRSELSWATVLHPDGSQEIVAVTPVAGGASDVWTSPATGARYPTHWSISIPSLHASLSVTAVIQDQEFLVPPRYEGDATVSGVYQGRHVTGYTYVELVH